MTTQQQIDEARKALEELTTDEAELSRLQSEQVAEIDALKAAGSRDFATLATLEGRRAALAAMLGEQRASIDAAQAQVVSLEAEKVRAEALAVLRDQVAGLTARRQTVDALITEMVDTLKSSLARIVAERLAWHDELETAREDAVQLFKLKRMENVYPGGGNVSDEARAAWRAAYRELGADAELALTTAATGAGIGSISMAYAGPPLDRDHLATVDTIRSPLNRLFDAPIKLALGGALYQANQDTPHVLKGEGW